MNVQPAGAGGWTEDITTSPVPIGGLGMGQAFARPTQCGRDGVWGIHTARTRGKKRAPAALSLACGVHRRPVLLNVHSPE
jgi:hypothetical protein